MLFAETENEQDREADRERTTVENNPVEEKPWRRGEQENRSGRGEQERPWRTTPSRTAPEGRRGSWPAPPEKKNTHRCLSIVRPEAVR